MAAGAMAKMATSTAEAADEVHKGSQRMGISTDAYQELDFWASQNGMSQQDMEKAVGRLNQRMGDAANGNEKYSTALESLGVSMDDVREGTISTDEAFATSIQSLSEMENGQEQAALASELFGTKLGREMLPALQDGALSLEDAKEMAHEYGMVMGEEAVNSGVAFTDALDQAQRALGGVTREIGAAVLPILTTMLEWVMENLPAIREMFSNVFTRVKEVFDIVIGVVQEVIGWFNTFRETNEENFTNIYETIQEKMAQVQEIIQIIWAGITAFWQEHGQQLMTNAIETFTTIWETVELYLGYVWEIWQSILGRIVPFVQEQLDKVAQFWDENGDKIMAAIDVISNAVQVGFEFIQSVISVVMPIVQGIIESAWGIIETVFSTAIDIIMGLVDMFASLLTGDFEGAKEAVTGIWESLWEGIKGIVSGAWGMLSGAFSSLWSEIEGWFSGLVDDALGWGKNMIGGFIDGIKAKTGAVGDAASNVASTVGGWVGFNSPADKGDGRYIEDWGANMIDGFLDGAMSKKREVGKVMNDIVGAVNPKNLEDADFSVAGSLTTGGQINRKVEHEIKGTNNQPAYINLNVGGRVFKAFVDDITNVQDSNQDLELSYS
ncbi:MAG: hypothetical protein L0J48_00335 [Alkalibacterium sp.]|nr:hypothetical protein [Alkalibacterium sp.]